MAPTRRALASLVSLAVLALTASGCGGDEPKADKPTPVSVESFLDRLKSGMGEEGSVHVEMSMTGPAETSAEGDTTYGPDGSEMRMSMEMPQMGGGEIEMVVADGAAYMSMPGFTKPGEFFKVSGDDPALEGLTGGAGGMSPADSFAGFDAGLQEVEELGEEELDGTTYEHFGLRVDAAKAMAAMQPGQQPGQPGMQPGLPETLQYDVWLDSDDRMRRIVYELQGVRLTMDMTDWGQDVEITAPDKEDLVEAPPGM